MSWDKKFMDDVAAELTPKAEAQERKSVAEQAAVLRSLHRSAFVDWRPSVGDVVTERPEFRPKDSSPPRIFIVLEVRERGKLPVGGIFDVEVPDVVVLGWDEEDQCYNAERGYSNVFVQVQEDS